RRHEDPLPAAITPQPPRPDRVHRPMRMSIRGASLVVAAGALWVVSAFRPAAATQHAGRKESDTRRAKVLASLAPAYDVDGRIPLRWTLDEQMARFHVPAVSIAVVDDGRIVWSAARGTLEAGR